MCFSFLHVYNYTFSTNLSTLSLARLFLVPLSRSVSLPRTPFPLPKPL